MVVRQLNARQSKHVELREALILLQTGGYTNEAERLYRRLVRELDRLPNRARAIRRIRSGNIIGRCARRWRNGRRARSSKRGSWPRSNSEGEIAGARRLAGSACARGPMPVKVQTPALTGGEAAINLTVLRNP